MKYLLLFLFGASFFPSLTLALEILCPTETVKELISVGVKPLEAVKLCENYVVCKTKSKIKEFEKIGYNQEEINKICDPNVRGMEKISESARNRALTSWRA